VHELLAFVAAAGLDGVPTVRGFDADGREVLSFVEGEALDPGLREPTDDMIQDAAAWLRRYHDVVRDWRPGPRAWRQTTRDLAPGEIICHNDPGTYNWVIRDGGFAGMIDWDQAGPGHPLDDLAFLCWTAAPLCDPAPAEDVARRVRIAAEAYGELDPGEVLDAVAPRLMRSVDRIAAGIDRGDPGMLSLQRNGEPENTRRAVEAMRARLPAVRAALGR
jgi:aminoglycoside phosphotransferase